MPVTTKPIFYYLPLFQGGPQDQEGVLCKKMHMVKFGQKYTGGSGEFNGRVVVYSHGGRKSKKITIGNKRYADGATFYQTHFFNELFDGGKIAAFAALKKVELAMCHSGMAAPAFLDSFSQGLPNGVVARGPIDAVRWGGDTWRVGKGDDGRTPSGNSSSGFMQYFLKGDVGGLDDYFRKCG